MAKASLHTIGGAGHFMTATHAVELAEHVSDHVMKTESLAWGDLSFVSPFGITFRNSTVRWLAFCARSPWQITRREVK